MKDYLYIFLHLPKTAGVTFRYHVNKNLKKDKYLIMSYQNLELDSDNPTLSSKKYQEAAFRYLKKLSKKERENIKVIYGHLVHYGIDQFFSKPARYFVFFRNPIDRTVSVYSYLMHLFEHEDKTGKKKNYYQRAFLIDGKVPSFNNWLKIKYNPTEFKGFLTMAGWLRLHGFADQTIKDSKSANSALKKFYFIGLTENYNEDALYLYDKLGFKKYFIDQNISLKKFDLEKERLSQEILKVNKEDAILYQQAILANMEFKKANKDFIKVINRKGLERNITLPFTQLIFAPRHSVIRFVHQLTRKMPIYAKPSAVPKTLSKVK